MKEALKTALYVCVAIAIVLVAALTYPKQEDFQPPDLVGKPLFADFTDPSRAAEMRIIKYREEVAQWSEFELKRDDETGLWVIPSSGDYPADADAQMRDAATSFIDLRVLGVAARSARDHETYGVIEPDRQKVDVAQQGVGLRVNVKDTRGEDLADLIIGKRVKGTRDQYFVRQPAADSVYVVKIDPSHFSTVFQDWIDRDLLRINPLDIADITLRDYSIIRKQTISGRRGTLDERFEAKVNWDVEEGEWNLDKMVTFREGEPVPTELLPTEELDAARLNALKESLTDMQILDVRRKPAGLGADLKAGTEILNNEASLNSLMNRGFYLIRVQGGDPALRAANGEILVGLSSGVKYVLRFGEIPDDVTLQEQNGQLSRYLFVTARLDESKFPPLNLQPLPTEDDLADDSAGARADLELRRERIRKENQRKKDARQAKLQKAEQQVAALNARFADWYYIIPDEVYTEIQLGRNELIRDAASAAAEGFGVDAFRRLQQQGIAPEPKKEPKTPDSFFRLPGTGG